MFTTIWHAYGTLMFGKKMSSNFFVFLLHTCRDTLASGARQSLNTEQINHLAFPSSTLHLWTLVAQNKSLVWTLAQSVSNK